MNMNINCIGPIYYRFRKGEMFFELWFGVHLFELTLCGIFYWESETIFEKTHLYSFVKWGSAILCWFLIFTIFCYLLSILLFLFNIFLFSYLFFVFSISFFSFSYLLFFFLFSIFFLFFFFLVFFFYSLFLLFLFSFSVYSLILIGFFCHLWVI